MSIKKNKMFYTILTIFFVSNLLIGSQIELSFDESYYWMYSEYMSWGYFDHPPMVAVFIKMGTALFGHSELAVRFFFNVFMCASVCLMWSMVEKKNQLIFWVSILSMPLIYFSGILALPDTALLFFGTLFFYILKKYMQHNSLKNILLLALTITCLFYSKYHGLLIVMLTVFAYPAFLRDKSFYAVVGLVILLFLPHMYWQYKHEFVSFKFHLTGRREKHFDYRNILDYVGGQVGLMGIFNFFIFCIIFYKNKFKDNFEKILVLNSFGFLTFLLFMSFRNQIEANWTITCSVAFIVLFISRTEETYKKPYIILSFFPIALGVVFKLAVLNANWIADNIKVKDNRINEIVRWKSNKIPQILKECEGRMIVGDNFQITSKVAFYTKKRIPALHLNSRESHYTILNLQKNIGPNQEICFLSSKARLPSVKIESYYKDPVFVAKKTTLRELAKVNGTTYEEIIRD
jgi:4-amino-4-deoxy-L-arabinose transferase-like glycosyltransferase